MNILRRGIALALLLTLLAVPAMAWNDESEPAQAGGVHFGEYTLEPGQRASGDLVVFGGPVLLSSGSTLSGDLTVFGTVEVEREATLDGQLVVFGSGEVAGTIEGDLFAVDGLILTETATVVGDVAVAGTLDQHPGATVLGTVKPMTEDDWTWPGGIAIPGTPSEPVSGGRSTPRWVTFLWRVVRGIASVVVMGLLALLLASLWPTQVARVGRTIEEAPLVSFGVGLLTLILSGLVAVLLAITICLSPLALVGMVVVGIGLLVGWVALGLTFGRQIMAGLSGASQHSVAISAVVGTVLITALLAISRLLGPLNGLLIFLLVPPVAGAVLLTRFGSRPYATRGVVPPSAPVAEQRLPATSAPANRAEIEASTSAAPDVVTPTVTGGEESSDSSA